MKLFDMFPRFSLANSINRRLSNTKVIGYLPRRIPAASGNCSDHDDLRLCQNGGAGALATRYGAMSDFICIIFLCSFPTQISRKIAGFISVFMCRMMSWCGRVTIKRSANQHRNSASLGLSAFYQINNQVSVWIWKWTEQRSGRPSYTETSIFGIAPVTVDTAPHPAEVTHLIVRPVFDNAPFFGYWFVSHSARLLRVLGQRRRSVTSGSFASTLCPIVVLVATLLAGSAQAADTGLLLTGVSGGGGSTYVGPGDIVSGATAFYGLRAYNAAYAATPGLAVNVRRASDNVACDFNVSAAGGFGVTTATCNSSTQGGVSFGTFVGSDGTASCTLAGTTGACTGASGTVHVNDTVTGTGLTQPCIVASASNTAPTIEIAGTTNSCGTVSVAETFTFQVAGFVTELYDQSGNGHHVTQATAGSQPQLLPNSEQNGLPGFCFLGSSPLQSSEFYTHDRSYILDRSVPGSHNQLLVDKQPVSGIARYNSCFVRKPPDEGAILAFAGNGTHGIPLATPSMDMAGQ